MNEQARFSFFQISDTLFDSDSGLKSLELSPAQRKERTEEGFQALEQLLTAAVDEQVEAVLIPGNLYDSNSVSSATISRLQTIFARLRQTPIIISPGCLDSWREDCFYNQQTVVQAGLNKWPRNVYVFNKQDFVTIRLPASPAVSITCHPFVDGVAPPALQSARLTALRKDDSKLKILLAPLSVPAKLPRLEEADLDDQPALPVEELDRHGFAYAAVSGRPSHTVFTRNDGSVAAACSGSLFGQSDSQTGPRSAILCRLRLDESGQLHRDFQLREFDRRRIVEVNVDVTGATDQSLARIRNAVQKAGARDGVDLLILRLIGSYQPDCPPHFNLDEFRLRFYHFKFQDRSRPDFLSATVQTPTEHRFLELIADLQTRPGADADLLEDTMYFGLSALREGRIQIRDAD